MQVLEIAARMNALAESDPMDEDDTTEFIDLGVTLASHLDDKVALLRELAGELGLVGRVDMAVKWSVSEARARQLAGHATFPEPVAHIGTSPVWIEAEVDAWRTARSEMYGNGGPKQGPA